MSERIKLTPPALARRWGVSVSKVIFFIESGELQAINLARSRAGRPRYAIDLDDIADFEERRRFVGPQDGLARPLSLKKKQREVKDYFP